MTLHFLLGSLIVGVAAIAVPALGDTHHAKRFEAATGSGGSRVPLEHARGYFHSLVEGAVDVGAVPLMTASLDTIWVAIEDFRHEDDYLALAGSTLESADSRVMLKGTEDGLYGWVVLFDEGVAYEYTTADGVVEVASVPIEKVFPVCRLKERHRASSGTSSTKSWSGITLSAPWRTDEPHVGDYPGIDLYALESRPGAATVLFLDISEAMNGDTPVDFSKEEMWKAWQTVAAGFSAFELNVTTNESVYDAASTRNKGVARFFTTNEVASCPLGAFGSPAYYCSIFTHNSAETTLGYGVGRTTLHEVGHLLGLGHDGTSSDEYFTGFSRYSWYPIMGNYYAGDFDDDPVYQWSDASYSGAVTYYQDNPDDLGILAGTMPYRPDDIPTSRALVFAGATSVASDVNRGQINTNTDSDSFTFEIGSSGGHATLSVSRIEHIGGGMLDVELLLRDASGAELAHDNPEAMRSASVDIDLTHGTYELVVKGGTEGAASNGFSNYSSLGFYGIDGEITGAVGAGSGGTGGTGGDAGSAGDTGTGGDAAVSGGGGTGGALSASGGSAGAGGRSGVGGASGSGGIAGSGGGAGLAGGSTEGGSAGTGGRLGTGGRTGNGGVLATGGQSGIGGGRAAGGDSGFGGRLPTGGWTSSGGGVPSGGLDSSGGTPAMGGTLAVTGGVPTTGGTLGMGGASVSSGALSATGAAPSLGSGGGSGGAALSAAGASSATDATRPSGEDSGCGCRVPRSPQRPSALGLFAALGLVMSCRRLRGRRAAS